jgi:hypothetical protein
MHRLSDPQQLAGAPFGKARVREVDGEKPNQTLPKKMASETIEIVRGPERPEKSGFCGVEFG